MPGDDYYLEMKQFQWDLVYYDEFRLKFRITFDNPAYISVEEIDTIKITITKSETFLSPVDDGLSSVPDGYTITIKCPP